MMEAEARRFFERYAGLFRQALGGEADMDDIAALYAPAFIASTPAGVATGENGDGLKQAMAQGYARYREIGTRDMRLRAIRVTPMGDDHCVAHVAWTATYAREGRPDLEIDFDVHYLLRFAEGQPKVFGWVSGDEQALLRRHGIV